MKKSINELEHEIADAELALLDARAELSKESRNDLKFLGVGIDLQDILREKVTVLAKKLNLLKQDLQRLQGVKSSGTKFAPGELKKLIEELAKRDGFKVGNTVPSARIKKWLKEISDSGKSTTEGAIRAVLSGLTITKERK